MWLVHRKGFPETGHWKGDVNEVTVFSMENSFLANSDEILI